MSTESGNNKIQYEKIMKHSIANQFTCIFVILLVSIILMCWILNSTLLEKYYQSNKQESLMKVFNSLNEEAVNGNLTSIKYSEQLQNLCGIYNIDVIVLDENSEIVVSTIHDVKPFTRLLMDKVFLETAQEVSVYEETDSYVIEKAQDPYAGIQYLSMWGILDNGNIFMVRTAMEGIRDSVQISNRFLAYIGIIVAIIGGIIIMIISQRITLPIMQLAHISQQMSELNFEAKYQGKDENEIGILGTHINHMSEKLENTISELKTANNKLMQDIKQKEEIDEMRKEFLANVSHELKTPIALILGYAEGLKDCIHEDEESREFYSEVIMDEAMKMDVMVKKLLTLNQLESGNDDILMERFDLTEVVEGYIKSIDVLLKQNEITLSIYKEKENVYVWGDAFKIEEVLMNYISNAINHVDDNKQIKINIQLRENVARVSVFNSGKAIPQDSIGMIWDKFYKVDKARTREYGGSGVGLSIVKAIMESMHQNYGVNNVEDGVEFWFELATK